MLGGKIIFQASIYKISSECPIIFLTTSPFYQFFSRARLDPQNSQNWICSINYSCGRRIYEIHFSRSTTFLKVRDEESIESISYLPPHEFEIGFMGWKIKNEFHEFFFHNYSLYYKFNSGNSRDPNGPLENSYRIKSRLTRVSSLLPLTPSVL